MWQSLESADHQNAVRMTRIGSWEATISVVEITLADNWRSAQRRRRKITGHLSIRSGKSRGRTSKLSDAKYFLSYTSVGVPPRI